MCIDMRCFKDEGCIGLLQNVSMYESYIICNAKARCNAASWPKVSGRASQSAGQDEKSDTNLGIQQYDATWVSCKNYRGKERRASMEHHGAIVQSFHTFMQKNQQVTTSGLVIACITSTPQQEWIPEQKPTRMYSGYS